MKKLEELAKLVNYAQREYLLVIYGNAWEVQFHQTDPLEDKAVVICINKDLERAVDEAIKRVKKVKKYVPSLSTN